MFMNFKKLKVRTCIFLILLFSLIQKQIVSASSQNDSSGFDICFMKGMKKAKNGDYFEAEILLNRAYKQSIPNTEDYLKACYNLGLIYKKSGQYNLALDFYFRAETALQHMSGQYKPKLGKVYQSIGNIYRHKNMLEKAISYYLKSQKIFKKHNNQIGFGGTFNNIGWVKMISGNYNSALSDFKKALDIYSKHSPERLYIVYSNLVNYYKKLNNIDSATHFYNLVLYELELIFGNSHLNYGICCYDYALFCLETHQTAKAKQLLDKTLSVLSSKISKQHPYFCELYSAYGDFYFNENLKDSSLYYYQKGLYNACGKKQADDYYSNPENIESADIQILKAVKQKADGLFMWAIKEGKTTNRNKTQLFNYALVTYQLALKQFEQMRQMRYETIDKEYIAENLYTIFNNAAFIASSLYNETKNQDYFNIALEFSEKSKSSSILKLMQEEKAKTFGGLPQNLIIREADLKQSIFRKQNQIKEIASGNETSKKSLVGKYRNELFDLKRQLWDLRDTFKTQFPKYYALNYQTSGLEPEKIMQSLKDDETLLEYMLLDSINGFNERKMLIFVITNKETKLIQQDFPDSLNLEIDELMSFFSPKNVFAHNKNDYNRFVSISSGLYEKLLQPMNFSEKKEKIIIIPDGKIAMIPFDILIKTKPDNNEYLSYKNLDYLIKHHTISYVYSAYVMLNTPGQNVESNTEILACAPNYADFENDYIADNNGFITRNMENLRPLPGAKREVKNISAISKCSSLFDEMATEESFKKMHKNYGIIHLAMHTLIDNSDPMYSKLIFSQKGNKTEDGVLDAWEIYCMELKSKLVVLSACKSGAGQLQKGEGIMSLARGFVYAGSPSVVMTLWTVEDKAGAGLMTEFYKNLFDGKSKNEALRSAKLQYLENADPLYAHPYFWSGYVNIGTNDPIVYQANIKYWIVFLIAGLIFSIALINKKRKLKRREYISK